MQSWKVLASSWWWEEQGDYSDEVMGKGRMGQEPGEHETLKSDMLFGKHWKKHRPGQVSSLSHKVNVHDPTIVASMCVAPEKASQE